MKEEDIRRFKQLIQFLGCALGPDYEIVLSDLHSVLAISNSNISGRTEGAPITDAALRIISEKEYLDKNWKLNYRGTSHNGHLLRCSTFFIKDSKGALSGLLCINFDDSRYKDLADRVFSLCHSDRYIAENIQIRMIPKEPNETFYRDINSLVSDAFRKVTGEELVRPNRTTYKEKLDIIRSLYQSGVFSIKGAIPELAKRLSCSQASMYRYLTIVKKEAKASSKEQNLETETGSRN